MWWLIENIRHTCALLSMKTLSGTSICFRTTQQFSYWPQWTSILYWNCFFDPFCKAMMVSDRSRSSVASELTAGRFDVIVYRNLQRMWAFLSIIRRRQQQIILNDLHSKSNGLVNRLHISHFGSLSRIQQSHPWWWDISKFHIHSDSLVRELSKRKAIIKN